MNPILSIGLLNIGKEAVESLIKKPSPSNRVDNIKKIPFSQYLDRSRTLPVNSQLVQFLKDSSVENLADLENTLFHLTQQLIKDPALAQFTPDYFRNGYFSLQGDGSGRITITGPNGEEVEFFAQSKLGEQAEKIQQLSMMLHEATVTQGGSINSLAQLVETKTLFGKPWGLQLQLR